MDVLRTPGGKIDLRSGRFYGSSYIVVTKYLISPTGDRFCLLASAKRPPTAHEVDVLRTSKWQCPETVRKSSGSRPPNGRFLVRLPQLRNGHFCPEGFTASEPFTPRGLQLLSVLFAVYIGLDTIIAALVVRRTTRASEHKCRGPRLERGPRVFATPPRYSQCLHLRVYRELRRHTANHAVLLLFCRPDHRSPEPLATYR